MEILNAKIEDVSLTMADHGCLTFYLHLKMQNAGVSVGGYCIGHGYLGAKEFDGYDKGTEVLMRIMDTVGVDKWEDLKGKFIRIKSNGWGSIIDEIGNIIDDKWLNFREFFTKKVKEEE